MSSWILVVFAFENACSIVKGNWNEQNALLEWVFEIMPERSSTAPLGKLLAYGLELDGVDRVLSVVRRHLGMDVAFVARFLGVDRVLEHVDENSPGTVFKGQKIPLNEGYCQKVVNGQLPEFIPDTSKVAAALQIPETHAIPIGSHLSTPIRLDGDRLYGTLCCFSHQPNDRLGWPDMLMLRAFSELLGMHFGAAAAAQQTFDRVADEIRSAMDGGMPRPVFQPVYTIATGELHGFECLSRFDLEPLRPPDQWFKAAHEVGMGLDLERHAIDIALGALLRLPAHWHLSVNCSPQLILSGQLPRRLGVEYDISRVTLEITEHAAVDDYDALAEALAPLRRRGATLAVDDAGAGYSSMRHILCLQPDMIKLDMSITHNVHADRSRRALAKGLTSFAHEIGSVVVAEGVETSQEFEALASLGVDLAQGYFLARPMRLEQVQTMALARA